MMKKIFWILLACTLSACSSVRLETPIQGEGKPANLGDYWAVLDGNKKQTGVLVFTSAQDAYYISRDNVKHSTAVNPNLSARDMVFGLRGAWHYSNLHCMELDASYHACSVNLNNSAEFKNMLGLYQRGSSDSIAWFVPKLDAFLRTTKKQQLHGNVEKDDQGKPERLKLSDGQLRLQTFLKKLPKDENYFSRSYLIPLSEKAARNTIRELQGNPLKKR